MKKLYTLLIAMLVIAGYAWADDTKETAAELAFDTPVNGYLGKEGEDPGATWDNVDWYKVTIPDNGKLSFTLVTTGELKIVGPYMSDDRAGTSIGNGGIVVGGSAGTYVQYHNHLQAGTYWFEVPRWTGNYNSGNYSVTASFIPVSKTDTEPNDTKETATPISVGAFVEGNTGYQRNGKTDNYDWYSFKLEHDAELSFELQPSAKGVEGDGTVAYQLYHQTNPNQVWAWGNVIKKVGVKKGTYCIRVIVSPDYGEYKFKVMAKVFDAKYDSNEGDEEVENAKEINVNTDYFGTLGFVDGGKNDPRDWRKFTLNDDGKVSVFVTDGPNVHTDVKLYKQDGETVINPFKKHYKGTNNGTTVGETDSLLNDYALQKGSYYIALRDYSNYDIYKLRLNYVQPQVASDQEPNNEVAEAQTVNLGTEVTGRLGYVGNNPYDSYDWFKFSVPSNGELTIQAISIGDIKTSMYLYDETGKRNLGSVSGSDTAIISKTVAKGVYTIKMGRSSGYCGDYKISTHFVPAELAEDQENNNFFNSSIAAQPNKDFTGHLGYSDGTNADRNDCYAFTLSENAYVELTTVSYPAKKVSVNFYMQDTTQNQEMTRKYMNDTTIYAAPLVAGKYYFRMKSYNPSTYKAFLKIVKPRYANDDEQQTGGIPVLSVNGSNEGQLGFKLGRSADVADTLVFTCPAHGTLKLNLEHESTLIPNVNLLVKRPNGYYSSMNMQEGYTDTSRVFVHNKIAKGTYYLVLNVYGSPFGSYRVNAGFEEFGVASDAEPNQDDAGAIPITLGYQGSGLLGYDEPFSTNSWDTYYYDNKDVYKLTLDKADSVYIEFEAQDMLKIYSMNVLKDGGQTLSEWDHTVTKKSTFLNKLEAGVYWITITSREGMGSYTVKVRDAKTLSARVPELSGVHVYPVPFDNVLCVSSEKTAKMRVYNLDGRLMLSKEGIKNSTISTSGWPRGGYIIKLEYKNQVYEKLVIKN